MTKHQVALQKSKKEALLGHGRKGNSVSRGGPKGGRRGANTAGQSVIRAVIKKKHRGEGIARGVTGII